MPQRLNLRLLPAFLVRRLARRAVGRGFVVAYVHPYDVDEDDERLTILTNPLLNRLLYYNRRSTLPKLAGLARIGESTTYADYAARVGT